MSTKNQDEKNLEGNIFYIKLLQELNKENPNVELLKFLDNKLNDDTGYNLILSVDIPTQLEIENFKKMLKKTDFIN